MNNHPHNFGDHRRVQKINKNKIIRLPTAAMVVIKIQAFMETAAADRFPIIETQFCLQKTTEKPNFVFWNLSSTLVIKIQANHFNKKYENLKEAVITSYEITCQKVPVWLINDTIGEPVCHPCVIVEGRACDQVHHISPEGLTSTTEKQEINEFPE